MTENTSNTMQSDYFRASVLGDNLKAAIQALAKNTYCKYGVPALNQCLIRSQGNTCIELVTFDSEMTPQKELVKAKVEIDGSILIPFDILKRLAPHIGNERIDLESGYKEHTDKTGTHNTRFLQLREGGHTTNLLSRCDVDEFPDVDIEHEWQFLAEFPALLFYNAYWQLENHTAKNDNRPVLTCISLNTDENLNTVLYATNSYSVQKTTFEQSARLPDVSILIPPHKGIKDVLRVRGKKGHVPIEFYVDTKRQYLKIINPNTDKDLLINLHNTSGLYGKYPNVESVIPKSYTVSGGVSFATLQKSLKQLKPYLAVG